MIVAWLWNFITPQISKSVMYPPVAKANQETYSKQKNVAQMYDLSVNIQTTKQEARA